MRISDWSSDVCSSDLLSPIDLQCVKASGVTFAVSAIERVIEERARGDAGKAAEVRGRLEERIGGSIRSVVPGSGDAATLKQALIDDGMWSQYLEVAIGPDAEIFTTSPRSEEHTSELPSLMRLSYAVLCLKNKTYHNA